MNKLKLAVVGAGHLGRIHAKLLTEMPDVELVGVVDPVESARTQVAAANLTTAFADHHELIGRIDAAVIATPTRHHHAVALDFLREQTPLLIEKPLAGNLTEAEQLVQSARLHGTLVQVGHIERFNPAFASVATRIKEPRYVEAVRASGFTGRSTDIGVVHDLMIHDIDLLLSLVDSPVRDVRALGLAILGRPEDVAQARIEFENGCVANLSASRVSVNPAPKRQMQIWSAQGFAGIDFGNRTAHMVWPHESIAERKFDYNSLSSEERADFKERLASELLRVEPLIVEPRNALADELREFVDCVRTTGTPRVTVEHGRDAVALAERILQSIQDHSWCAADATSVGPSALPAPAILRGPHWPNMGQPQRREAG